MTKEYGFSHGKRRLAISTRGKTRITFYLDDRILAALKSESARSGTGYQLINQALARHIGKPTGCRKTVRKEFEPLGPGECSQPGSRLLNRVSAHISSRLSNQLLSLPPRQLPGCVPGLCPPLIRHPQRRSTAL